MKDKRYKIKKKKKNNLSEKIYDLWYLRFRWSKSHFFVFLLLWELCDITFSLLISDRIKHKESIWLLISSFQKRRILSIEHSQQNKPFIISHIDIFKSEFFKSIAIQFSHFWTKNFVVIFMKWKWFNEFTMMLPGQLFLDEQDILSYYNRFA